MKIKNDNIFITRGETNAISIERWNLDGTPFILPPVERRSIRAIAKIWQDDAGWYHYDFNKPLARGTKITGEPGAVLRMLSSDSHEWYDVTFSNAGEYVLAGTYVSIMTKTRVSQIGNCYDNGVLSVAALTVRTGSHGEAVHQLFMNLSDAGLDRFTSYDIDEVETVGEVRDKLINNYAGGRNVVVKYYDKDNDKDQFYWLTDKSGKGEAEPYGFALSIPFVYEYTCNLRENEYTYDIAVYQGVPKDLSTDEFPLKDILWKIELVSPHKFIIGDSYNA